MFRLRPGSQRTGDLRVKGGEAVAYNFVWQRYDDRWLVVRECTLHDALPGG